MNNETFMPDGKTADAFILATVLYPRSDFARIARGADPADFAMVEKASPVYGIVYAAEGGIGFYIHPRESGMDLIFKNTYEEKEQPVSFFVRKEDLASVRFSLRSKPSSIAGWIRAALLPGQNESVRIGWRAEGSERAVEFICPQNAAAFRATLESLGYEVN